MKIKTDLICPLCGCTNPRDLDVRFGSTTELVLCDPDDGGCDNYFAVEVGFEITPKVKVFELKASSPERHPPQRINDDECSVLSAWKEIGIEE